MDTNVLVCEHKHACCIHVPVTAGVHVASKLHIVSGYSLYNSHVHVLDHQLQFVIQTLQHTDLINVVSYILNNGMYMNSLILHNIT